MRLATHVSPGQTIMVTGDLGSVGRAAVHSSRKLGARLIAGVRTTQLSDARSSDVAEAIALDDVDAVAGLDPVNGVADITGGETAAKLLAKVRLSGRFGYASALPEGVAENRPHVTVSRVFARPNASKLQEFADDLRDGNFVVPISRSMPPRDVGAAHERLEKGGGKVVLTL